MKKVPSYLKGLAETRARAAGDVERLRALQDSIAAAMSQAAAELEACDVLIRKFDARLDPAQVQAIRGQNRYGKRGELKTAMVEYLRDRAPAEVTTTELSLAMQAKFKLDFLDGAERERWQTNSVRRMLKMFVAAGVLERLHDPRVYSGLGRWRWVGNARPSLDHWQAAAAEGQATA